MLQKLLYLFDAMAKWKTKKHAFAVPMIWREPTNNVNDSYFCLTKVSGYLKRTKTVLQYYFLAIICMKIFQCLLALPFQSEIMLAAQQNRLIYTKH